MLAIVAGARGMGKMRVWQAARQTPRFRPHRVENERVLG